MTNDNVEQAIALYLDGVTGAPGGHTASPVSTNAMDESSNDGVVRAPIPATRVCLCYVGGCGWVSVLGIVLL